MGEAEKKLWALLRNRRHTFKFRRQHPIGPYFLDFYCAEARLCIELDGEFHVERRDKDAIRDAAIAAHGIETLRIPTTDLYDDPEGVAERIWLKCRERLGVSEQ